MSVEIPYDVIEEVRIAVLKETNLSSYNLDDASFPSLPSLESSISELDPSPPHLRCKHCKGRLLRGVESLICVFCGKQQVQQEAPPQPINFMSTFGCRWLLQSLALDGSEIVEGNESNRGQRTTQEEFSLSDVLDLEIKWYPDLEKVETQSNKSPSSFIGVNLDNFVTEGKRDAVSQEQVVEGRNIDESGNDDFQVRDSFSYFENVQRVEPSVRSIVDERGGGAFDGWEANFQSCGDGNSREESKSFDPAVGSSVDLSAQMDVVCGSGKNPGEDKEKIGSSESKTNDWFQDDLWSGSNSHIFDKSKDVEMTADMKDGGTVENVNISSSMGSDFIQDGQHRNETDGSPNNLAIHEEDNSFDDWNDFTSSSNIGEAKQVGLTETGKDSGEVEKVNNTNITSSRNIDLVQEEHLQINNSIEIPDNKTIDEEDGSFDVWNDFASSTSVQDTSNRQTGQAKWFEVTTNSKDGVAENATISSSVDVDWFQDNQWKTTADKAPDNKTVDVDNDLFDAWNDFTSSTSAQDTSKSQKGQAKPLETTVDDRIVENANNSSSIAWIQDDHWPSSSNKTPGSKTIDEAYDLFDTWNDFTSSTSAQDLAVKQTIQSKQSEMTANAEDHRFMEMNNSSFDWFQGNQGQTSSSKPPADKTTNEGHDLLDVWNGFTSSTGAHNPNNMQSVNHMAPSFEQPSEIQFTETHGKSHNDDFGSFSQANFLSGAFGDQNGSKEVNIAKSEPSVSHRVLDLNANGGGNTGEVGDVSIATTRSTIDDVEKIMSQMHDLSFMLASNLSIPSKTR